MSADHLACLRVKAQVRAAGIAWEMQLRFDKLRAGIGHGRDVIERGCPPEVENTVKQPRTEER